MNARPYVGVTGAVSRKEVREICTEFSKVGYSDKSQHIPMLGFLVSYKTLNREAGNRRYPHMASLLSLLEVANEDVLTMIHYNSKEMPTLYEQVARIFDGMY